VEGEVEKKRVDRNRRNFLKITGGGIFLGSIGVLGGKVFFSSPNLAILPWKTAEIHNDPRVKSLAYAILSPNPHNRQPWEMELVGKNEVKINRDLSKNLPHTDPYDRQLTIGMGCFIETMVIAASNFGYRVEIELFPDQSDKYFANAKFLKDKTLSRDSLFEQITSRRSCKEPYKDIKVPREFISKMEKYGSVYANQNDVQHLKRITKEGFHIEIKTKRTFQESIDLMRFGKKEINKKPDGIDLSGFLNELAIMTGILSKASLLDTKSFAYKENLRMYDEMLNSTPAYILLKSKGNSRFNQVDTGRKWMRANLLSTKLGLALHPVSQVLQEYPEMSKLYRGIHNRYANEDETIQMIGRLGFGVNVPPSPRWDITKKIINL
jgi:hypothetical protein